MSEKAFEGQVALVTGSSKGIGAATALALAAAGDPAQSGDAILPPANLLLL